MMIDETQQRGVMPASAATAVPKQPPMMTIREDEIIYPLLSF
jgi:hypothetical protein